MVKVASINGGGMSKPSPTANGKPLLMPPQHYLSATPDFVPVRPTLKPIAQYSSPSRLVQAFRNGVVGMTYNQAVEGLMVQFGFSNMEAIELMGEEGIAPTTSADAPKPELLPPVEERGDVVIEDDMTISAPIYDFFPSGQTISKARLVGIVAIGFGLLYVSAEW